MGWEGGASSETPGLGPRPQQRLVCRPQAGTSSKRCEFSPSRPWPIPSGPCPCLSVCTSVGSLTKHFILNSGLNSPLRDRHAAHGFQSLNFVSLDPDWTLCNFLQDVPLPWREGPLTPTLSLPSAATPDLPEPRPLNSRCPWAIWV